jgi:hypothetical protein
MFFFLSDHLTCKFSLFFFTFITFTPPLFSNRPNFRTFNILNVWCFHESSFFCIIPGGEQDRLGGKCSQHVVLAQLHCHAGKRCDIRDSGILLKLVLLLSALNQYGHEIKMGCRGLDSFSNFFIKILVNCKALADSRRNLLNF